MTLNSSEKGAMVVPVKNKIYWTQINEVSHVMGHNFIRKGNILSLKDRMKLSDHRNVVEIQKMHFTRK